MHIKEAEWLSSDTDRSCKSAWAQDALCPAKGRRVTRLHWVPGLSLFRADDSLFSLISHIISLREAGGVWARARWYAWHSRPARRPPPPPPPAKQLSASPPKVPAFLHQRHASIRRDCNPSTGDLVREPEQRETDRVLREGRPHNSIGIRGIYGQYFGDSVHVTVEIPICAW